MHSVVRSEAVSAVAETDLERAKQMALGTGNSGGDPFSSSYNGGNATLRRLALTIAETDLFAAGDWLKSQTGGTLDIYAFRDLGPTLAAASTADAVRFIEQFAQQPHYAAGHVAFRFSPTEASELASELRSMPPSRGRDAMLSESLQRWASTDPDGAIARGLELLREGESIWLPGHRTAGLPRIRDPKRGQSSGRTDRRDRGRSGQQLRSDGRCRC
jgi:hypothetical protein